VKNQRRSKTGDECFQIDHVRFSFPCLQERNLASCNFSHKFLSVCTGLPDYDL